MYGSSRASSCETVPLTDDLLAAAADLFVANYEQARAAQPLLPPDRGDRAGILKALTDIAGREKGVGVMREGRLVGYGIGFSNGRWHGWPSVFAPEWANATQPEDRPTICRELYTALSRQWAADGCLCHLVCMPAHAAPLAEWQWMGFGLQCVDALRGLDPPEGGAAGCEVRRAQPEDAETFAALMTELREHLSAPPVFLPAEGPADPEREAVGLADAQRACFLADLDGRVVGYLTVGQSNPDAGWTVQDSGTASVDGAYTLPACRGRGVATALLRAAVDWARESGYVRVAVDFEAHNAPGAAFWLRHFEPVSYAVARYTRLPGTNAEG